MPNQASLDHENAYRYAAAWASFDHDDISRLGGDSKEFFGTLGSLEFQYVEKEKTLHVWAFVIPGAGLLLTTRAQIKTMLDRIATGRPEETAGAVFDIKTLDWNKQAGPTLEPRLWLRLDVFDSVTPVEQIVAKFSVLSRTGYAWHKQKFLDVTAAYWKEHPKPAK